MLSPDMLDLAETMVEGAAKGKNKAFPCGAPAVPKLHDRPADADPKTGVSNQKRSSDGIAKRDVHHERHRRDALFDRGVDMDDSSASGHDNWRRRHANHVANGMIYGVVSPLDDMNLRAERRQAR